MENHSQVVRDQLEHINACIVLSTAVSLVPSSILHLTVLHLFVR